MQTRSYTLYLIRATGEQMDGVALIGKATTLPDRESFMEAGGTHSCYCKRGFID